MYEAESNQRVESVGQLPAGAVREFCAFRPRILERTVLPWSEHCTECVWPTCYSTCDLYSPREDGRCRRFVDGMVRIDCPESANSYLIKVSFKRWGKLWTPGNLHLRPLSEADRAERRDQTIGSLLQEFPMPARARHFAVTKRYSLKKRLATSREASTDLPDLFVMECFNPSDRTIGLSLTMRPSLGQYAIPFQRLISVAPGFRREEIALDDIMRHCDLRAPFSMEIIPNDIPDGTTLYFGIMDFVKCRPLQASAGETPKTVKCIVWDLDNTLWNGILVEDGAENLTLKPGIAAVLEELDRRGILHSIASKNNADEAMAVLRRHALDGYFLHPQISWTPKSVAVQAIARELNIGIDSLLFVDDSEFELAQVQAACPGIRVLRAERYLDLPGSPLCRVPVTEESAQRRRLYQQEAVRESAAATFSGDYLEFLRECAIEVQIQPLSAANLERVHELTQRTNQMNFSGNRYERRLLEEIATAGHLDTYVIGCQDRFGSYGIVGFSVVDRREPRMTDLMFSCRIQSKRVEHAFLGYLLRKYRNAGLPEFWANYRKTPRNAPSGRVFADLGMEEREERDGVTSLVFPGGREIPAEGVIQIVELGPVEQLPAHVSSSTAR